MTIRELAGKRVLVTGGAGFIGSNLVHRLVIHEQADVTVLDDFFTGSLENLKEVEGGYRLVEGSVVDYDLVDQVVGEHEIVIHAAARNIIVSLANPRDDMNTNIGGTLNILQAASRHGTERVIYTSSVSVYGNSRYLPINEDDRVSFLSPYAVSKYSGEAYCSAFHEAYDLPVCVIRYSNVYGPRQDPDNPYCGVVSKFMDRAMRGDPPLIHGDGLQTRDFTYVSDAVEATLLAAISPKVLGETINIGSGIETNVRDLATLICQLWDLPDEPIYTDKRDIDNIRRRVVNIEKARRKLRWVPQVTLPRGLARTKAWFDAERLSTGT